MGPQQHIIATKGLSKQDLLFFTSMLQIVHSKLEVSWHFTEATADAEVVLVDLENATGQDFWHNATNCVKVAYARQNTGAAKWFLSKPIRVQPLIQLLNALTAMHLTEHQLADTNNSASKPTRTSVASGTPQATVAPKPSVPTSSTPAELADNESVEGHSRFKPHEHLLGLIQQASQQSHIIELRCASLPPLYIVPTEQRAYIQAIDNRQLSASHKILCAAYAEHIEQKAITVASLHAAVKAEQLHAYPLETLLWLATLHGSHGHLIMGLHHDQHFKLKRWPNFANLPHQSIHMNLTAFMVKNSATISMIAQKTYVPTANIINFINACYAIHLLEAKTEVEPATLAHKTVATPKRRLFQSILQKLMVSS